MKADIVGLKQLPAGVGQKMLAQMLLHSVQTHRPIQHSLCLGANLQRLVALMVNVTILFTYMAYDRISQLASVTQLTAALRKENRLVQLNQIFAILRRAGRNLRYALFEQRIIFKKLNCHFSVPLIKCICL